MFKKKALVLILAAATALTVFPPPVLADETTAAESETPSVLIYSEDFEEEEPEIYVFTDKTGEYETDEMYYIPERFKAVAYDPPTEGNTQYGSFYSGSWTQTKNDPNNYYKRVGYQFSNEGITKGKVRVKFKFRSNSSYLSWGIFLLGNNTTTLNWIACVGFDKYTSDAKPGIIKMMDDKKNYVFQDSIENNTWYSYDATIDLDNRSIVASVYDKNGQLIKTLTWTDPGTKRATTGTPFTYWPNSSGSFSVKSFAGYTGIDLDDIEIYTDQPLEATDLEFLRNDGKVYTGDASFLTARSGQLTFNYIIDEVQTGAVKIGDTELTGTISEDGFTYTFDIPTDFVAGKEHTITVDYSKIRIKAGQQVGEGTKEFTFTPKGVINYSEDFDGATTPTFVAKANNGTSGTLTTKQYQQMTEGGNSFGRSFYIVENDITDSDEKYYTTDWSRPAIDFDTNGVTDGKLKIHFRFRPTEETIEGKKGVKTSADATTTADISSFGSVLIGNSDQMGINGAGERIGEMKNGSGTYYNDARGNWLSLIDVNNDKKLRTLGVGGGGVALKDSDGNDATVEQDKWYTCDAVLDLDNRALDVRVVEDGSNKVFRASKSDLPRRINRTEWNNWPTALQPCFKSFGMLAAIDIDDIQISTDCSPSLTATQTTATAKVTTARKDNYMIIAQYYENDKIAAVTEKKFTLDGQAAVYSQDITWAEGAVKAKAFIWDNLNDANPLEKFAEITRP